MPQLDGNNKSCSVKWAYVHAQATDVKKTMKENRTSSNISIGILKVHRDVHVHVCICILYMILHVCIHIVHDIDTVLHHV